MIINNKFHLTYCTNIFKEKDLNKLILKSEKYIIELKKKSKKSLFSLGLCTSQRMLNTTKKHKELFKIKNLLKNKNIYINSINSFVYKSFHKKKTKEMIYLPDWSSKKRFNYTNDAIKFLTTFIKKKQEGSITTLPISYKKWIKINHKYYLFFKSSSMLIKILKILKKLHYEKKKLIHLDIEPEPRCTIETIKEFINFFYNWLIPTSIKFFNTTKSKKNVYKYIRICYDICHLSVNFENHNKAIKMLKYFKIKIGRIQITSALKFIINNNYSQNNLLSILKKSSFLHQSSEKIKNKIKKYDDFFYYDIKKNKNKIKSEIRIHFHVPIYINIFNNIIKTTQIETIYTLKMLIKFFTIKNLEIETYTNSLLYKNNKIKSIIKEYKWTIKQL